MYLLKNLKPNYVEFKVFGTLILGSPTERIRIHFTFLHLTVLMAFRHLIQQFVLYFNLNSFSSRSFSDLLYCYLHLVPDSEATTEYSYSRPQYLEDLPFFFMLILYNYKNDLLLIIIILLILLI